MGKNKFVPRKSIRLNASAIISKANEEASDILKEAATMAVEEAETQLTSLVGVHGPGAPDWLPHITSALDIGKVTNEHGFSSIRFGLIGPGGEGNVSEEDLMAAYVTEYGIGSSSTSPSYPAVALSSKPGEQVWGDDPWMGKHLSTAKTSFQLPTGFNQAGVSWWKWGMDLSLIPIQKMAQNRLGEFQKLVSSYVGIS